jgi:hypothetical protein
MHNCEEEKGLASNLWYRKMSETAATLKVGKSRSLGITTNAWRRPVGKGPTVVPGELAILYGYTWRRRGSCRKRPAIDWDWSRSGGCVSTILKDCRFWPLSRTVSSHKHSVFCRTDADLWGITFHSMSDKCFNLLILCPRDWIMIWACPFDSWIGKIACLWPVFWCKK